MSRSGYSDDCDNWALIRYRGAVESAIRGARGQAFLKEMLTALDSMPVKELVEGELEADGSYCALGVVGKSRGINLAEIDAENSSEVAQALGISRALAKEIVYMNDESMGYSAANLTRWQIVRNWAVDNIKTGVAA